MSTKSNNSISVDCVIFGFNDSELKVLLAKYNPKVIINKACVYKLPGRMIFDNESLDMSANKIAVKILGTNNVSIRQMYIFSDPERVSAQEIQWINERYSINSHRVITVAYYGVTRITKPLLSHTSTNGYTWVNVENIKHLPMDHKKILMMAMANLYKDIIYTSMVFDLLPKKFTVRKLQTLYELILGIELDNRNFRKKILGFLSPTGEFEKEVSHKPAEYFTANKRLINAAIKRGERLFYIKNI